MKRKHQVNESSGIILHVVPQVNIFLKETLKEHGVLQEGSQSAEGELESRDSP